jgi:phage portal protein BeeE
MGFWRNLLVGRDVPPSSVERGTTQDWVDAFLHAQEFGLLRTTMANLDEEQVSGSLNGVVKNSSPVFALTLARMQVFSQARFQWTRYERGEPTDLFGNSALGILERPWLGGTTADLLARMELDVTGAGNSYTRRVRRRRGAGDFLVRLRPDWVIIILGSMEDVDHPAEAGDVELLGYAYAPNGDRGDRMILLGPDEVGHYAPYPDPDNNYVGMSWLTPAMRDVMGDQLQTEHKRAFLRNAATPNMVIKFDPAVGLDSVKKFKALFEAEHKGSWNAYKTLFLGGGADAVVVGKDFKELDFAVTQGKAESRMAAAAGVPPSWVGFSEGLQGSALNAGNFTSARRRFGDGTMQHLWGNASSSLEAIVDRPDDGAHLWFATRGIPFLRMDKTEEAAVQSQEASTIAVLIREGYTPDSVQESVVNHDWSRLVHTNLLSVQLQPAGTTNNGSAGTEGAGGNS